MGLLRDLVTGFRRRAPAAAEQPLPGEPPQVSTEIGRRATPEASVRYVMRQMWVDPELRSTILDIRDMDRADARVKRIHGRTSRAAVKGGLKLQAPSNARRLHRAWSDFERRLRLNRRAKLESDMRGLMMEGNLPLQWVLGPDQRVVSAVRMPTDTIVPRVSAAGQFLDVRRAYDQVDPHSHQIIAQFPLWQLSVERLEPDNYDDWGSLGRPYLDATRKVWRQLRMTEEDLVIRRRTRAPMRLLHVMEGMSQEELQAYQSEVEQDAQHGNWRDFYTNKKGQITPIQGDARLDEIADVSYLLDTFFSGAPAPKGLFGYSGELKRDILEDLKQDYYAELDAMQDAAAFVYELGFRLDLLLRGQNPDAWDFSVVFAERRTETRNQRADLALKYQALGVPDDLAWETAGLEPRRVREEIEAARRRGDVFPDEADAEQDLEREGREGAPNVNVTPSNARKGESATTISTRNGE